MSAPWEDFQQPTEEKPWEQFQAKAAKPKEESTWDKLSGGLNDLSNSMRDPAAMRRTLSNAGNMAAGGVRGAGSIGATILSPIDWAARKLNDGKAVSLGGIDIAGQDRRTGMDQGLESMGADPNSIAFKTGKVGGEVAGTAGVGGALANTARVLGASAPVVSSLASGGFNLGGGTGSVIGNILARGAGGGAVGVASTAMVDPEHAGQGAVIGGLIPMGGAGVAKLGGLLGNATKPASQKTAAYIADKLGFKTAEQKALLAEALDQPNPQLMRGYKQSLPEIIQTEEAGRLSRNMRNLSTKLAENDRVQNTVRNQVLDDISSISGTVQDAKENAGNVIGNFATSENSRLKGIIGNRFENVDPFGESKILLPIDALEVAKKKFMGDGWAGSTKNPDAIINTAKSVGTETVKEIKPLSEKGMQDLVMAVRSQGGINLSSKTGMQLSGEIKNLRESGLNNLVRPKTGKSIERLSETLHEQGFIPNNDPATLLNYLQNAANGEKYYGGQGAESAYRNAMEAAQGAAPAAGTFAKPVDYKTVQNLRASINQKLDDAVKNGQNNEAASLAMMKKELDSSIDNIANGKGTPEEFFAPDMVKEWRGAIADHTARKTRFETGPQIGLFRNGGDGQRSIQGAEIPGKFFSPRGSQVADMESFNRLRGDNTSLQDSLKNYAITDLANQTERTTGQLTNAKVNNWLKTRSGAIGGLFSDGEQAQLNAVGKSLENSAMGEFLGKIKGGSDTIQNRNDLVGFLDNPISEAVAGKIPFGKNVLGYITKKVEGNAANNISEMMIHPDRLSSELKSLLKTDGKKALTNQQKEILLNIYKANPALISNSID
jgi:hypothetical protein